MRLRSSSAPLAAALSILLASQAFATASPSTTEAAEGVEPFGAAEAVEPAGAAEAFVRTDALSADTARLEPPAEWQQEVGYSMEVKLDEEEQVIRGALKVRYRNASPDSLDRLYFHLHLNAFRPNSVWAREEERPQYDFQALQDPDYGYERLRSVRLVEGPGVEAGSQSSGQSSSADVDLTPRYPHSPDSTVVRFDLPEELPPDGELTLHMEWDARPATLCRRQCRQGRQWDLAQWYPRIAVYDHGGWQPNPLHPQGEFYGEFGTYDVTLDLPEDQVVGATGVPVEGDPGWAAVAVDPEVDIPYMRDWYDVADPVPPATAAARRKVATPDAPGVLPDDPEEGRRRVRFHAREVHHFAWSVSPDFRYEGGVFDRGRLGPVAIHVLYRPDRPGGVDWGDGVALERTIRAMSWTETVFRPYPYPQLTNLHRLEGGGTEFPMLIMDGSPSLGLIVHEVVHQYIHGILANNEWKEAWLDEGVTTFLTSWFFEEAGAHGVRAGTMERVAEVERRRQRALEEGREPAPLPVATVSHEFTDFDEYVTMAYSKAGAVLFMLREMVGPEAMRRALQHYYDRYAFRHVNEAAFRDAMEAATGEELDWFFHQWLHTNAVLDYSLDEVETERTEDGRWRTRIEVVREGDAWMPVTLRVDDERGRLESRQRRQVVEVVTDQRPRVVELDPDRAVLDIDRTRHRVELD